MAARFRVFWRISMDDFYEVTDGRQVERFPYTEQGLHDAWISHKQMRHSQLTNPNRIDLLEEGDYLSDGLTEIEHELIDEWEHEDWLLAHEDEMAEDKYWQDRLDEARGK